MESQIGLHTEYGESPSLTAVHMQGRLEGLLLSMKVRQHYRNTTDETLETIYTFPAGWGTELLGFSLELGGKRMQAQASPKQQAEETYEDAIEDGDTPVMIEKSSQGLFTANIGNLKPGEEAVIEIEYTQLQRFEQGRIRITVPTVVGQRYGHAQAQGHLQPHQQINTNVLAQYPFTAKLQLVGDVAKAQLHCPSHACSVLQTPQRVDLVLNDGASMDRDWVIVVEELPHSSFTSASSDGDYVALVAAFCPNFEAAQPQDLVAKVLIDCSGSMAGESIDQAREAMHEWVMQLKPTDQMSYSRFGNEVQHMVSSMMNCTPYFIQEVLAPAIHETDANMGGTELHDALASTFEIANPKSEASADVLLITDGDVWDIDRIVDQARQSQHRIFAIGVGSAPAESLLRDLAEQSGGACELVTPQENMAQAVLRMMQRMRSARTNKLSLKWANPVVWQSNLPKQVFSGETVFAFALLQAQQAAEVSSPTLEWQVNQHSQSSQAPAIQWAHTGHVARLVAAQRIRTLQDNALATDLAMHHQLLTNHTHLILVHERANEDKAQGVPKVQNISQMHAAGHSGLGRTHVYPNIIAQRNATSVNAPRVWYSNRSSVSMNLSLSGAMDSLSSIDLAANGMDDIDIPAFLKRTQLQEPRLSPAITAGEWIQAFNDWCAHSQDFEGFIKHMSGAFANSTIEEMFNDLIANHHFKISILYAVFMQRVLDKQSNLPALSRHAKRLLKSQHSNIDAFDMAKIQVEFEAYFGGKKIVF